MSQPPTSGRVEADTSAMRLQVPAGVTVVDVLLDGHRVWTTRLDSTLGATSHRVPWPPALAERLRGSAVLEVRRPDGETLASSTVAFSADPEGPDLTDERGGRLSLTKYGNLRTSFDSLDQQTIDTYLDQAEQVVRALADDCQRPAFLDYGTLLGAVRAGRMIGHDLDIDIGYLSRAQSPADAMRDSFDVERVLRRTHGWRVQRKDGGLLQVFFPQVDGRRRNIDIFTAFFVDGTLYQVHDTRMPGDVGDILPLTTVMLEGRQMPAPHRPEKLLESLYGPGWRVPDPSFSYDASSAQETLRQWFVGPRYERDQWSKFYAKRSAALPTSATPFAAWVRERTEAPRLVDVGCGNGRDAVYFAQGGTDVLALDAVPSALAMTRDLAHRRGVRLTTRRLNLHSRRQTLASGAVDARSGLATDVYARFLLHCLSPESMEHFWRYARMVAGRGQRCFVEFRTPRDRGRHKHFAARRHRFVPPATVVAAAQSAGARVVEQLSGTGLAPFHDEDPYVSRMVVQW